MIISLDVGFKISLNNILQSIISVKFIGSRSNLMPINQYVFDSLGRVPENFIRNERHTITVKNGYDFHYFIPTYAPFFQKDFKMYTLTQQGAKRYLVEGVDYVLGFRFIQAITSIGEPIYGAVSFINRSFAGDVYIDYRTIGGDWNIDLRKIQEIIANLVHNPIITSWEQVANIPYQFPPNIHTHPIDKVTTVEDLIKVIRGLGDSNAAQIQNLVTIAVEKAIVNINKDRIGLGRVENLGILPINRAADTTDNYYTTPRSVKEIIDFYIRPLIQNHIDARGNVHDLSASDINAYTKPEVNTLLGSKLDRDSKAADSDKLDGKSVEQLKDYVLSGTADNTVKFNNLSYTEFMQGVTNRFNAELRKLNQDTSAAINAALSGATVGNSLRFNGKTDEEYWGWVLQNYALDAEYLDGVSKDDLINEARSNVNAISVNGKTANQIISEARQNTDAATLNGRNKDQIVSEARTNVDAKTLDGLTKEQLRNYVFGGGNSGNINASTLQGFTRDQIIAEGRKAETFGGRTPDDFKRDVLQSLTNINASTLENKSLNQIRDEFKLMTVANATRLDNKSYSEILSALTQDLKSSLMASTKDSLTGDLNNLSDTDNVGFHYQSDPTLATTANHYPENGMTGTIIVMRAKDGVQQMFIPDSGNVIYKRKPTDTEWTKIAGGGSGGGGIAPGTLSDLIAGSRNNIAASEKAVGDLNRDLSAKITAFGNGIDSKVSTAVNTANAGLTTTVNDLTTKVNDRYTKQEADNKFLVKPTGTAYLTKTEADGFYLGNNALVDYYNKQDSDTRYLTKADASTNYLTTNNAAILYLAKTAADSTYLSKSDAGSTYLTQATATTDYLSKADATSLYLTKSGAASSYVSKSDISGYYNKTESDKRYALKSAVGGTGLTLDDISNETNGSATNKAASEKAVGDVSREVAKVKSDLTALINSKDSYTKQESDSKYLLKTATTDYLTKSGAASTYLTKTEANNFVTETFTEGRYLPKTVASSYVTKADADNKYLLKTGLTGYLTSTDANNQFVSKTTLNSYITTKVADGKYLLKGDGLTKVEANKTFIPRDEVTSTYLPKVDAEAIYVKKNQITNFLTQATADTRYLSSASLAPYMRTVDADKAYVKKTELGTYLTKAEASSLYLTQAQMDARYALKGQGGGGAVDNTTRDAIKQAVLSELLEGGKLKAQYMPPAKWG